MSNMSCKRKKKWLGAVISGVANIASTLISAKSQANAAKQQQILQQNQQAEQAALQNSTNLTAQYNNTDYVDAMKDKIVYRAGGKINDRVAVAKRFACGGRTKKNLGGSYNGVNTNTIANTDNMIKSNTGFRMARMGTKYKRKCSN